MKTPLLQTAVLLLSLIGSVCAQSLPNDAQELLKKQQAAISRLNDALNSELEKVKARCMKDGDLEGANAVAALIKNPESAPILNPADSAGSEKAIVGEYAYTYLSNGYQESWIIHDGGKVDFSSKRNGDKQGQWRIRNGILIVEKPWKPNLTYHFPVSSFVSMRIDGDKGAAMITKKKK